MVPVENPEEGEDEEEEFATSLSLLGVKQDARNRAVVALVGQLLCFILILIALTNDRDIAVNSCLDFLSRYVFALISQFVIIRDLEPIMFSGALNELNLMCENKGKQSFFFCVRMFRLLYNCCMCCIIPYYIMSIDNEGEEGYLDLIQNFTSLYIMCDID